MDPTQFASLIPIATFWLSFGSIVEAVKLAHEHKEKLVRKEFQGEYATILRSDTKYLCVGVEFAILVFTGSLAWLACALWQKGQAYYWPSILVWAQVVFTVLTAWMFGRASVRFFSKYK